LKPMKIYRALLGLTLLLATTLTSCSYKLGVKDRRFPGGYEFVSVPVFKNRTQETSAELYFTNQLIEELRRSRLVTITSKSEAQVVIEGTIKSITYLQTSQTQASSKAGDPGNFLPGSTILNTQYNIDVVVEIVARRTSDEKIIWQSRFENTRPYTAPQIGLVSLNGSNSVYNNSAHYQNIEALAVDMMAEAHDRLTENF
jgi:hypothetical protein